MISKVDLGKGVDMLTGEIIASIVEKKLGAMIHVFFEHGHDLETGTTARSESVYCEGIGHY